MQIKTVEQVPLPAPKSWLDSGPYRACGQRGSQQSRPRTHCPNRPIASPVPVRGAQSARNRLISFQEMTAHYRLVAYAPGASYSRVPCRTRHHLIHVNLYESINCPACCFKDTLIHAMWVFVSKVPFHYSLRLSYGSALLASSDPKM